ncbi:MAG: four helix bundle protein [Bacteroidota bacterium]|jgi:four helix bundle protein
MQDYRKLKIWQKAHELVLKIYIATKKFPKEEMYGITSQIRRSSASITANISEGCGRKTKTEFARFLVIALGSINETKNFLLLSKDLGYLTQGDFHNLTEYVIEMHKMLLSLESKISNEALS